MVLAPVLQSCCCLPCSFSQGVPVFAVVVVAAEEEEEQEEEVVVVVVVCGHS